MRWVGMGEEQPGIQFPLPEDLNLAKPSGAGAHGGEGPLTRLAVSKPGPSGSGGTLKAEVVLNHSGLFLSCSRSFMMGDMQTETLSSCHRLVWIG